MPEGFWDAFWWWAYLKNYSITCAISASRVGTNCSENKLKSHFPLLKEFPRKQLRVWLRCVFQLCISDEFLDFPSLPCLTGGNNTRAKLLHSLQFQTLGSRRSLRWRSLNFSIQIRHETTPDWYPQAAYRLPLSPLYRVTPSSKSSRSENSDFFPSFMQFSPFFLSIYATAEENWITRGKKFNK